MLLVSSKLACACVWGESRSPSHTMFLVPRVSTPDGTSIRDGSVVFAGRSRASDRLADALTNTPRYRIIGCNRPH